ncbi:hypothetical protein HPP92_027953 [Vanilla planifolia]|uniref:RNA 3'-terminal phosphate cyclase domain-containing protein n=1 Tax=Vanilla planifolia TaxID=51239 RepID=A0A835U545_VANPL|nr:hypothetical protein HPP92_027953 [Vanilla planifolia]KAG0448297.1 hypothetical protein HPP92_027916 [Vanilla planifolia]
MRAMKASVEVSLRRWASRIRRPATVEDGTREASSMKLKGSQFLRQRLLHSTLTATPIIIKDIRAEDTSPGLRLYEISLLRLLEKISDD